MTTYEYVPKGTITIFDSDRPFFISRHVASGWFALTSANTEKIASRCLYGVFDPGGVRHQGREFEHNGRVLRFAHEIFRDYLPESDHSYDWEAWVVVPAGSPSRVGIWTEAYARHSQDLREISDTFASHARRVRMLNTEVERFSSREIFDRDGWVCGLCGLPIDPELKFPDHQSASLDHILPIAAGGSHTRANVQASHWICNVRKGAKT